MIGKWISALTPRFFLRRRRVHDATAIAKLKAASEVRVHDRESTIDDRVRDEVAGCGRGRPRSDHGPGVRVHGLGNVAAPLFTSEISPPAERGMAWLPAVEHVDRFIDWLIYDEDGEAHTVRVLESSLFPKYLLWCERFAVAPIPEKTLQTLLGKRTRQVDKTRERFKDRRTGRVLRNENGTPLRQIVYTINPPRAEPVLPGKPPVAELVEARPILTKQQREAQRAALEASAQLDLPMRRVA